MSTYKFGADLAVAAAMPGLNVAGQEAVKLGVLAPFTGVQSSWVGAAGVPCLADLGRLGQ